MYRELSVILFDLGGVLVELPDLLSNADRMDRTPLSGLDPSDWQGSPAAKAFEKGEISAAQFADELLNETHLTMAPEELLRHFTFWPKGLFPGTRSLIARIQPHYSLAVFSNTNELHWPRLMTEMALEGIFDHYFASFQIGLAKPDPASFRYVVDALSCKSSEILFLDDSRINVAAARLVGLNAERVCGIDQAEKVLSRYGVLTGP